MANTRQEAWNLIKEYNKEPFHRQHALTVEGCMRYFAKSLGYGDEEEFWGLVGLLHDLDYEKYPEEHCRVEDKILRKKGWDEKLIHAVVSHGYPRCSDVAPELEMEKVLYAVDELSGLIGAAALMRPSKSVQDMEVKSLKKKFKDKHFAAGCSRDVIKEGADMLGWDLNKLFEESILAMRSCEAAVAEAMKKELARGGQVYYLHDRVDNIEACAAHVSQMVPGARVGIAHGKMTEEELNPVWQHLLNGEIDILVCTTLIETGIDVRNCNTLIIEDADRMGLAQLYQIRGRVGRSGRKAYAYFTFRRDKTLTDIAQKRLSAIREFTAFGSGFRIAMRDLQIRGAGSLLGHSQHGHMEAVGYDLYVKLLGQAIARAKGEPVQRDKSECLIDLRVDAYIPETYIAAGPGRIEAYKRIAAIQTPEDAADVLDELIDRYGDPPPSVSDLVNVSLARVQATAVGVYEVTQKKDTLVLQVEQLDLRMIQGLLVAFNGRVVTGAGAKPYLSVTLQKEEKPLELLQSILRAMQDILKD